MIASSSVPKIAATFCISLCISLGRPTTQRTRSFFLDSIRSILDLTKGSSYLVLCASAGSSSSSRSAGDPPRSSITILALPLSSHSSSASAASLLLCLAACFWARLRASTQLSRFIKISRVDTACHSARCGCSACHGQGTWASSMILSMTRSMHPPLFLFLQCCARTSCCMRTCCIRSSKHCSSVFWASASARGILISLKLVVS